MLGDVRARKYSKTDTRTHSILEKFAFDTTLLKSYNFDYKLVCSISSLNSCNNTFKVSKTVFERLLQIAFCQNTELHLLPNGSIILPQTH